MTKNNEGRDRWHGATLKTTDSSNDTAADPMTGWISFAKSSRLNRRRKHGWQKGERR